MSTYFGGISPLLLCISLLQLLAWKDESKLAGVLSLDVIRVSSSSYYFSALHCLKTSHCCKIASYWQKLSFSSLERSMGTYKKDNSNPCLIGATMVPNLLSPIYLVSSICPVWSSSTSLFELDEGVGEGILTHSMLAYNWVSSRACLLSCAYLHCHKHRIIKCNTTACSNLVKSLLYKISLVVVL